MPRLVAAGLAADLAFGVLMAGAVLVIQATVPPCEGDSCMGGPRLLAGVGAVPFVTFFALVAGFLVARVARAARACGLAALATPVALLALATLGASLLAGHAPVLPVLFVLGPAVGPVAAVTAGLVIDGRGWVRLVALPASVVLIVGPVAVDHFLLTPWHQAQAVTEAVPQPYRLTRPAMTLLSLSLDSVSRTLDLRFAPARDDSHSHDIHLNEGRMQQQADLTARCAPALSTLATPVTVGLAVAATAPDLAIWRTAPDQHFGAVVVVRGDVVIEIDGDEPVDTDAEALTLVARLQPATAGDLLDQAEDIDVP